MSISFPKGTARIRDGKARVVVRCSGTTAQRCVGTLTLKIQGESHKAVFSIPRGKKKAIEVPLGLPLSREGGPVAVDSVAIARTEQTSGRPLKTKRKLRLK